MVEKTANELYVPHSVELQHLLESNRTRLDGNAAISYLQLGESEKPEKLTFMRSVIG